MVEVPTFDPTSLLWGQNLVLGPSLGLQSVYPMQGGSVPRSTTTLRGSPTALVRLPTHPPEDIPNGSNRQLREGLGPPTHSESIENIYTVTGEEQGFTDRQDINTVFFVIQASVF